MFSESEIKECIVKDKSVLEEAYLAVEGRYQWYMPIRITILFSAMLFCLTGCGRQDVPVTDAAKTEEPKAEMEGEAAENETGEIAEDVPQVQSEDDAAAASSVCEISTEEDIDWAIWSEGIYCYSNGELCGYLDGEGERITECVYEEAMPFSEGLACVRRNGKYGYIGKDGEIMLPFIYDQASSFREGVAYFSIGEEYGLIDPEGNVVLELTDCDSISSFREGLAYFSVDGRYGYMDKNGRIVVEPLYDDAGYFYEGLAVVMRDGLGGVIGKDGEEILSPEYIGISTEDTCILAQKEDGFFFFDTEGHEVSSGAWDWVSGDNDLFYLYKDDKVGLADRYGNLILEPIYEEIMPIPERKLVMVRKEEEGYGVLDYKGQITVPFRDYDSVYDFVKERAVVELNGKYGVLRYDGTLEIPVEYDEIRLFSDGSTAVWTGNKVELTDDNGNLILSGEYEYLWKSGDGYCTDNFGSDEKTKFWDSQGNLVSEYEYDSLASAFGVKNTYILDDRTLLKKGEESEESLEEVLLTNQITPRIGAFKDCLKNGSVSGYAGGVSYSEDMEDMRQWQKCSKLYQMGEEDSTVLFFYAEPRHASNFRESNSGLYMERNGRVEQLIGAGECGGSIGGDRLCFWYDTQEGVLKAGTGGRGGGFGGSSSSGDVYQLKNGEMVLENSFLCCHQYASIYSEETLLQNAGLFYDEGGSPYTEENILEAEYIVEYIVNEERVSVEEYNAARRRYVSCVPLDMN